MKILFRSFLASMLKESFFLLSFYNTYYYVKNKKKFWKEINRRKAMSIFEYKELVKPIPFCPIETIRDSNFYGQAYALKQYAGVDKFDWSIEHGLYVDDYVPIAARCKTTERIMTFSDIRVKGLESVHKPVVSIGPYIHYAECMVNHEEMNLLKRELGRTLLFFPTHTSCEGGLEYKVHSMIDELLKFKNQHGFDTVIVNMYYLDEYKKGFGDLYAKAGFKVTTAGHQLDINFLNRLKTIISLADYTCSNSIGTHTGYCIYLNKPHLIINPAQTVDEVEPLWHDLWKAFESNSPQAQIQQQILSHKYWGFDCVKSKEEMRSLLLNNK